MSVRTVLNDIAFNAKALGKFVPAVLESGIVDPTAGVGPVVKLPAVLGRYWFTLAREVEQAAITCPDRLALIDDDGALTYRQFQNDSKLIARHLLSLGLDEIRLGVMARNGRGILLPMAAKGYAGATIFLLNVGSSPEQLAGVIEENDINVLVIDDEFIDRAPEGPHTIIAHQSRPTERLTLTDVVSRPEKLAGVRLPVFPKHGAIVLMSSGTTGIPKGVVRPEPKLPFVLAGVLDKIPLKADMRVQMTASMFHTWGWSLTNICFAARHTVVTQRVFDPENCFVQIEKYRLHAMISSPIFLKQMLQIEDNEKYDTSSLEIIASSGNALTPAMVEAVTERFGPIMGNIYGSTELTLAASASAEQISAEPTLAGDISVGTRLKILDKHGDEVPTGTVGRIYLKNSTSLTGYTNPDIPVKRVGELVEMGDLGYLDEHNRLHVLGRIDDMIIVGGENVYPGSVMDVLEPMPGVADLHAAGVDDPETFERIAVWIVRSDDAAGRGLTQDAVREWVLEKLADHSVPRDVHFVDELPRNVTGKVVPRLLPGV